MRYDDHIFFLISFFSTIFVALIIIMTEPFHKRVSYDSDLISKQKFHMSPVPRVGGLALVAGFIVGGYFFASRQEGTMHFMNWAGIAAIPVLFGGLAEDLSKKISVRNRLLLAFISATIAYFGLEPFGTGVYSIPGNRSLEWEWIENNILSLPGVSLFLTMIMVGGVAHSTNIIDGFNGLLIGFSLLALTVFGLVSYSVGDKTLLSTIFIMSGSLFGLFIFNFPKGRLFTGDGGAYLIGFLLAIISLLIIKRNPEISPFFPLLVMIYPVFETLFSIYRKKYLRGTSPGIPDSIHLHMLVHKRVVPRLGMYARKYPNPSTAPIIWGFSLISLVPAYLWWYSTLLMVLCSVLYCFCYVVFYFWIVRFGRISIRNDD